MTVYVLRPDGGDGTYTMMNDNNDLTKVVWSSGSGSYTFSNPSIPSTEAVKQVRVRIRWQQTGTPAPTPLLVFQQNGVGQRSAADAFTQRADSYVELQGAWQTVAPDGGAWTPAKVNDLQVFMSRTSAAGQSPWVSEIYVDVETTTAPVVTVSAPTGTINDTMQPTITAAYTDAESDPMDAYQAKVFSQAVYSAGGFDPETATALWDSGVVGLTGTSTISKQIGTPLVNGTDRAYVKVRNSSVVGGHWSLWAYSQFTVSVTPANAPTLSVSPDPTNARMVVTITDAGPALVSGVRRFELQRTIDNGVTWTDVTRTLPTGLPTYTYATINTSLGIFDYEAPRAISVKYRARVRSELASGAVTTSAWTTLVTAVNLAASLWWLKGTTSATDNTTLLVIADTFTEDEPIDSAEFEPIDSDETIVIQGRIRGKRLSGELRFIDNTKYDAFNRLRRRRETMLLQDTNGRQWYCRFKESRPMKESRYKSGTFERRLPLDLVEVQL